MTHRLSAQQNEMLAQYIVDLTDCLKDLDPDISIEPQVFGEPEPQFVRAYIHSPKLQKMLGDFGYHTAPHDAPVDMFYALYFAPAKDGEINVREGIFFGYGHRHLKHNVVGKHDFEFLLGFSRDNYYRPQHYVREIGNFPVQKAPGLMQLQGSGVFDILEFMLTYTVLHDKPVTKLPM